MLSKKSLRERFLKEFSLYPYKSPLGDLFRCLQPRVTWEVKSCVVEIHRGQLSFLGDPHLHAKWPFEQYLVDTSEFSGTLHVS